MTQPQSAKHKPAPAMSRNFLIIPISVASSLRRFARILLVIHEPVVYLQVA
jgi:hypothetical protein